MIVILTTRAHIYTHTPLVDAEPGLNVKLLAYEGIPVMEPLPVATYIFTDMDRLSTEALKSMAQLYRRLKTQGCRVLNDPARFLHRSGLLRALFLRGINSFNAYRAEEGVPPSRWPVFLRTEGDHAGPIPELLHSPEELEQAKAKHVADGTPVSRLIVVEYMAEPILPNLYRKLSTFRMGERSFATTAVHDDGWVAQKGKKGVATPELYQDELRIVRDDPYGPVVAQAFDAAGIDYGRVDYTLVGGRVEIYEINTNPVVTFGTEHPSPHRIEAFAVFRRNFFDALRAIDTPPRKQGLGVAAWRAYRRARRALGTLRSA